jgi:hypothetical protein
MSDASQAARPRLHFLAEIANPTSRSRGSHELQGRPDRSANTPLSTFVPQTAILEVRSWRPVTADECRTMAERRIFSVAIIPQAATTKKSTVTILSMRSNRPVAVFRARAAIGTITTIRVSHGTQAGKTLTRLGNTVSNKTTEKIASMTGQSDSIALRLAAASAPFSTSRVLSDGPATNHFIPLSEPTVQSDNSEEQTCRSGCALACHTPFEAVQKRQSSALHIHWVYYLLPEAPKKPGAHEKRPGQPRSR